MKTLTERPLKLYHDFLKNVRRLTKPSAQKEEYHLRKLEATLGRSILTAKAGSELHQAITKAADTRKKAFNGGFIDDGANMRFRLGGAASRYLTWAHAEGLIPRNPMPKNPFRRPWRREADFLDEDRLAIVMRAEIPLQDQTIVRFLLDTGLRVSELCRVRILDLDFKERTISVSSTKTEQPRVVAFTESTRLWLAHWLSIRGHETPMLFCNKWGGNLTEPAVRDKFRLLSKQLGFRVHPHTMRHTAGTKLIQANEQGVVMRYLSHSDPGMTAHYIHLTGPGARKALEKSQKN